jgi:hypothetical protein
MEDPVDPKPNMGNVTLGLKMDVACPLVEGVVRGRASRSG